MAFEKLKSFVSRLFKRISGIGLENLITAILAFLCATGIIVGLILAIAGGCNCL